MKAKFVNEVFKKESDPIKDMGIGLTLLEEIEKPGAPELDERMEFDDDNEAYFSGKISHPMSGYHGSFEYIDIDIYFTKEEDGKYHINGSWERYHGEFPRYLQRRVDDHGEDYPDIEDWEDFNPHKSSEKKYDEVFDNLVDAVDFINNELDFEG